MTPDSDPTAEPEYAATCFRCGECCTRYQVLLDDGEMERVASYLSVSLDKAKADYTDPRWPVPGKYLLRHRDNGGCIFLVRHGKEALCSIHMSKPRACRDWTPALSRKECSLGLTRVWGLAANENGELCGAEHDKYTFLEYLRAITS